MQVHTGCKQPLLVSGLILENGSLLTLLRQTCSMHHLWRCSVSKASS
jgi:hypothetical protein